MSIVSFKILKNIKFAAVYKDLSPFKQKAYTLRNRVSYSRYYQELNEYGPDIINGDSVYLTQYGYFNTGMEYSYDIHGNVDSLLNIAAAGSVMNHHGAYKFKLIAYKYDLISGKVNEVHYQPGFNDEFYQRYEYDADNRLTDVYSTDNKTFLHQSGLEEHEAYYQYYKHGPLARMVLGQQQVQGVDYAYTLQGWLKGVNSTSLNPDYDMGEDGKAAGVNKWVARDVYGFNLNYFTGEYSAISTNRNPFPGHTAFVAADDYRPLYNGNISSMAVNIGKFNQPQLYAYKYDQLNRLVRTQTYRGLNQSANSWSGMAATADYLDSATYDGNGNILTYFRNGAATAAGNPLAMDNVSYHYNRDAGGYLLNNRLRHITDGVAATNYGVDIDNQEEDNYGYDGIGNLVRDNQEGIKQISWNVYGKIQHIERTANAAAAATSIDYYYDPGGNRVGKDIYKSGAPAQFSWYIRDAGGNVLAVYEKSSTAPNTGSMYLKEHHLYGSSRLGVVQRNQDIDSLKANPTAINLLGNAYTYNFERGKKLFELSNHLGNVLTTVSDKKQGVDSDNNGTIDYYTADIVSAGDYYPFGMLMPGRGGSMGSGNESSGSSSLPANPSYDRRSGNEPLEYVATQSIEFIAGFESGDNDAFTAYISSDNGSEGNGSGIADNRGYRYGFNGKEMDNEVSGTGTQYDYGFRIYDPRIGRFKSVDPLTRSFAMLTSYQYASNTPIAAIDLDGEESKISIQATRTSNIQLNNLGFTDITRQADMKVQVANWLTPQLKIPETDLNGHLSENERNIIIQETISAYLSFNYSENTSYNVSVRRTTF